MIGSFHRKNWHPTLIIFGFIVIFQNRDGQTDKQTDRQTNRQTDRQTDRQHKYIYDIYMTQSKIPCPVGGHLSEKFWRLIYQV